MGFRIVTFIVSLLIGLWPQWGVAKEKPLVEISEEDWEIIKNSDILEILEILEQEDIDILEELETIEGITDEEEQ